jgi:thioredoxin-like negative regulator of GroEL
MIASVKWPILQNNKDFFNMPPKKNPALQHFEELLIQDPHDTKARFGLATFFAKREKFKKSLEHLEIILSKNPHHKNAQNLQSQIEEKLAAAAESKKVTHEEQPATVPHPNGAAADNTEQEETELTGNLDGWDMCDME